MIAVRIHPGGLYQKHVVVRYGGVSNSRWVVEESLRGGGLVMLVKGLLWEIIRYKFGGSAAEGGSGSSALRR